MSHACEETYFKVESHLIGGEVLFSGAVVLNPRMDGDGPVYVES